MMLNDLSLRVGQVIETLGRQIAVPDWHNKYTTDVSFEGQRVAAMPMIRLSETQLGHGAPSDWNINTNKLRQTGLVCFVPERYLGMAILSVSIVAVREKSVIAQPMEWIEVEPTLLPFWIGRDAELVFGSYLEKVAEEIERDKKRAKEMIEPMYRAIWHNKRSKGV